MPHPVLHYDIAANKLIKDWCLCDLFDTYTCDLSLPSGKVIYTYEYFVASSKRNHSHIELTYFSTTRCLTNGAACWNCTGAGP
jgi:hypothetical protein